jgi:prepilin-type N-terminal cleavage/methylation domain-containing protein
MKRKSKGFTLIELLAIIVILAIIAVITVPIILNIIDTSKKGAARDSAYGYKEAIQNYYITELSSHPEKNIRLDGQYVVKNNGTLIGTNTFPIKVSGQNPTGGNISITNNTVSGCIQFDEYSVNITNGTVGEASKGTCPEVDLCSSMTPTSSEYFTFDGAGTITAYDAAGGTNVVIPCSINNVEVTTIGSGAFYQKGLTSLFIPETVTTLSGGAFNSNLLTIINIPKNITTIGNSTFAFNQITELSFEDNSSLTTINSSAFGSNRLTSVELPDSVVTIGSAAFGYNDLRTVTIGKNASNIEGGAFVKSYNCTNCPLQNENLTTIRISHENENTLDWKSITAGSSYDATTGIITHPVGNITVVKY